MARKCPPGVICIENMTILFIIIVIGIVLYYVKPMMPVQNQPQQPSQQYQQTSNTSLQFPFQEETRNVYRINDIITERPFAGSGIFARANPNIAFSNAPNDILLNPYAAPLRDDRYFPTNNSDPRGVPINTSTSAVDTTYRQVGLLKRMNGPEMLLPLMGRPLFTSRDKWNFYTLNENNLKLPVTFKQKSCTSEYGCDNIYNGDSVFVDGIDAPFKVTMYDNATMKYIPYL